MLYSSREPLFYAFWSAWPIDYGLLCLNIFDLVIPCGSLLLTFSSVAFKWYFVPIYRMPGSYHSSSDSLYNLMLRGLLVITIYLINVCYWYPCFSDIAFVLQIV